MSSDLLEAAAAAKHDLGKYVAFRARWLSPEATEADWLEALRADVLHTRRSAEGSEDAPSLWNRLRPGLAGLEGDADLSAVDEAVAALSRRLPALTDGSLAGGDLQACASEARAVATHLAALHRRLRQGVERG